MPFFAHQSRFVSSWRKRTGIREDGQRPLPGELLELGDDRGELDAPRAAQLAARAQRRLVDALVASGVLGGDRFLVDRVADHLAHRRPVGGRPRDRRRRDLRRPARGRELGQIVDRRGGSGGRHGQGDGEHGEEELHEGREHDGRQEGSRRQAGMRRPGRDPAFGSTGRRD
jgi:hypothetical protein